MTHPALRSPDSTIELLKKWSTLGWIRSVDYGLAAFIFEQDNAITPHCMVLVAVCSYQLEKGHTCLSLKHLLAESSSLINDNIAYSDSSQDLNGSDRDVILNTPTLKEIIQSTSEKIWISSLHDNNAVTVIRSSADTLPTSLFSQDDSSLSSPLVLLDHRLYLRRFWQYERDIIGFIETRFSQDFDKVFIEKISLPETKTTIAQTIDHLFTPSKALQINPPPNVASIDWQKVACAAALRYPFCIITGGPGTGKTSTVVRMLALLQSLFITESRPHGLRIALAAPTGKAAARLSESLGKNFDFLDSSDLALKDQISRSLPKQVTTLHRLLGPIPDSRFFKFNSLNRLPIDILVIDEASMVDTQMMAAVCNALPNQARLILLGDKDQLSSVEPGAVLGALCSGALTGPTQQNEIEWIKEVCNQPLTIDSNSNKDSLAPKPHNLEFRGIIKLSHSHRFQSDRGIGQLALFSNNSNAKAARSILNQGFNEIEAITVSRSNQSLLQAIAISGQQETGEQTSRRVGYGYYMSLLKRLRPVASLSFEEGDRDYFDSWATHVLQAYSKFQILCAVKDGPFGVEGINHLVTDCLAREGLIDPRSFWFEGRPVMITQNDHTLGLMNGDIGITFAIPSKDNGYELRVAFKSIDAVSGIKWVRPSRLNSVQTVFAMTVHKSQGSEFNHTLLILPEHLSPVLCKELIYTGITRASHWFTLCESGNPQVFEKALLHKIERRDGIIGN